MGNCYDIVNTLIYLKSLELIFKQLCCESETYTSDRKWSYKDIHHLPSAQMMKWSVKTILYILLITMKMMKMMKISFVCDFQANVSNIQDFLQIPTQMLHFSENFLNKWLLGTAFILKRAINHVSYVHKMRIFVFK